MTEWSWQEKKDYIVNSLSWERPSGTSIVWNLINAKDNPPRLDLGRHRSDPPVVHDSLVPVSQGLSSNPTIRPSFHIRINHTGPGVLLIDTAILLSPTS